MGELLYINMEEILYFVLLSCLRSRATHRLSVLYMGANAPSISKLFLYSITVWTSFPLSFCCYALSA